MIMWNIYLKYIEIIFNVRTNNNDAPVMNISINSEYVMKEIHINCTILLEIQGIRQ